MREHEYDKYLRDVDLWEGAIQAFVVQNHGRHPQVQHVSPKPEVIKDDEQDDRTKALEDS